MFENLFFPATAAIRRRWMASLRVLLFALLLPLSVHAQGLLGTAADAAVVQTEQVRAELLAYAPDGAAPGRTVWVGLQLSHQPEWHTYWKNSGDSGLPTELHWTLPSGVTAGAIAWPTPRKFSLGHLANYGFGDTVLLPVPLTISPEFSGSHVEVRLFAAWVVCRQECIPGEGQFTLRIPVQGSTALHAQAFANAFAAAPKDQPAGASTLQPEAGFLNVSLTGLPAAWHGQRLEFFPETGGLIEHGASWTQSWDGERWRAQVPLSPYRSDSPTQLPLVLALAQPADARAASAGVRIDTPVQGSWPPPVSLPVAAPDAALLAALEANSARAQTESALGDAGALTLWAVLLGALIGGMILNLMPCVFPVLAIKVLGFAKHAENTRAHRIHGIAYSVGVVLSFLALGGLLLGLRAAGEAIGWGFQLQSPAVVATLAVLFTLIGLNLAGLFEFGNVLPSRLASLQAKNPTADAFLTGVLATAIASPCTAPFMGAALGLAVGLPAAQALAVFGVLGLGMALPYLVASWVPAIARALPRPGAWMKTFRQFMAFPMFATVVWLLWILGQQSGIDGTAALLMLLLVLALLVWALGLRGRSRSVLAGLSLVGLAWLGWAVGPNVIRMVEADGGRSVATAVDGMSWEPWSPELQASLLEQGRPVFVNFTAAWCLTCLVSERTTLADASVLGDMAARNVALLRADWTRRDPTVTAALASLGRNSVPVYVIHQNGQPPQVLSELPSVTEIRSALARL